MIRTILLVATLATLAACNTTSDAQDAAAACSGVRSARAHDYCVSNYVNNARIGRDAEWSAAGSAYLSSQSYRRSPTCMNIGGIVTCN